MSTRHRHSIALLVAAAALIAFVPSIAAARSNVVVITRNLYGVPI